MNAFFCIYRIEYHRISSSIGPFNFEAESRALHFQDFVFVSESLLLLKKLNC